ncbi:MAG: glycine--tRNA ligase, partial [Flavobacterium sp.]
GAYGAELKNNIRSYWWQAMTYLHQNIVGIDAAIFMHPTTWKASGHVDAFNDPLIDNKDSKKRYRADVLIEDYCEKIYQKAQKEVEKARARFGDAFDKEQFITTNPRVVEYLERKKSILERMAKGLDTGDLADVKALIEELEIACPESGSRNWTEVRQFNLMFGTKLGAAAENAMDLYLRPETAQGIFVNFLNVQKSGRMKIPFGIAQTGKAFRNEIVARQFIFRMREFEQMEMQFFVKPGEEMQWYEYWKDTRLKWHKSLGLGAENYRFHDHEKLAHYANAAADIEFNFPFGFKELEGIHSRTDFDLASHEKYSGKKLQYFDTEENRNYVPYVVETSVGLDRMFLAVFSKSLQEEILEDGSTRTVLRLPSVLAPTKAAVLPLLKKDGLPEVARKIVDELKWDFNVSYDEKDAVGRRYRRQDALGTPFCITVDHQTLEDETVTLRHRDSMQQDRIKISALREVIGQEVSVRNWLMKM